MLVKYNSILFHSPTSNPAIYRGGREGLNTKSDGLNRLQLTSASSTTALKCGVSYGIIIIAPFTAFSALPILCDFKSLKSPCRPFSPSQNPKNQKPKIKTSKI
jgi:hypothetical protein